MKVKNPQLYIENTSTGNQHSNGHFPKRIEVFSTNRNLIMRSCDQNKPPLFNGVMTDLQGFQWFRALLVGFFHLKSFH